jgi:hypothetical protein
VDSADTATTLICLIVVVGAVIGAWPLRTQISEWIDKCGDDD